MRFSFSLFFGSALLILSHFGAALATLSPETVATLVESTKHLEFYGTRVLEREKDGRTQTIVLLGETHGLQSSGAHGLGQRIIGHFNVIGVEGLGVDNIGAGDLFSSKRVDLNELELSRDPSFIFLSLGGAVEIKSQGTPISSVMETFTRQLAAISQDRKEKMVELWQYEKAFDSKTEADPLKQKERRELYEGVLDVVELEKFDPIPSEVIQTKQPEKPALTRGILQTWAVGVAAASLAYVGEGWISKDNQTRLYTLAGTCGVLGAGCLLGKQCVNGSADVEGRLVGPRNNIMAKRAVNALNIRPEASSMLVIVGHRHVPGIAERLSVDHGFVESRVLG